MISSDTSPRRVVVTGLGAITAIGSGAAELWDGILCGRSGIRKITRFNASDLNCQIAAEVLDFDPSQYLEGKALKRLDRCSQFTVAAAKQAIADADIDLAHEIPDRVGVCIGSALGGAAFAEEEHVRFLQTGPRSVSPALALQMFVGAGMCNVAIELGATGFTSSNADSCASGPIAIGNAWHVIGRGDADIMLAGGAEAPLAPLCFGAFTFIRAMSTRNAEPQAACRPFDAGRDGFVMGEGSAVLVLEEREHAIKRGARIYAELVGFACTNDGHHMAAPRPDGESAARCVRLAMGKAGIEPDEIDYINAHASSTALNDVTETLALKIALGERNARRVPISGTKPFHGHALGATGAIEAVVCCMAMAHQYIPPTLNLDMPDALCDLDYVAKTGRKCKVDTVLSNSFGFGGINASLVFKRVH